MARIVAASDRALLVTFSDVIDATAARSVRRLLTWLREQPVAGVVDLHPAYASLLVSFAPLELDPTRLEHELARRIGRLSERSEPPARTVVVPVRYGGACGPDLDEVGRLTTLSPEEVARLHAEPLYEVSFLGFTPGFPYLTGLPSALATPRRATPRRLVEAGSVAIAGTQAGIYPVASPGGWNVIGRTDLILFDPSREPPTLLAPGDRVRFVGAPSR